jgi:hypothetical protein
MVSIFHVSRPLKNAFTDVPENHHKQSRVLVKEEIMVIRTSMQLTLPMHRIIRVTVITQSGNITLKVTPMLIPSMSIG